jgi:cobalt/nickel transport system permease protein
MHIPDGFINPGVSAAAGVVSAGGIGYSLVKAKETLSEKLAPMAGLVAAFIFAVQMLNFPVAAGTSGHLLGGCLAAILVGPYVGRSRSRWCWWCRRCCSPTAGSPRSGSTC